MFKARVATYDEGRHVGGILTLEQFIVEYTDGGRSDVNHSTFDVRLARYGDGLNLLVSAQNAREAALVARLHVLSWAHLRNRLSIAIGEATVTAATYDAVRFAQAVVGDSGRTALYSLRNFAVKRIPA